MQARIADEIAYAYAQRGTILAGKEGLGTSDGALSSWLVRIAAGRFGTETSAVDDAITGAAALLGVFMRVTTGEGGRRCVLAAVPTTWKGRVLDAVPGLAEATAADHDAMCSWVAAAVQDGRAGEFVRQQYVTVRGCSDGSGLEARALATENSIITVAEAILGEHTTKLIPTEPNMSNSDDDTEPNVEEQETLSEAVDVDPGEPEAENNNFTLSTTTGLSGKGSDELNEGLMPALTTIIMHPVKATVHAKTIVGQSDEISRALRRIARMRVRQIQNDIESTPELLSGKINPGLFLPYAAPPPEMKARGLFNSLKYGAPKTTAGTSQQEYFMCAAGKYDEAQMKVMAESLGLDQNMPMNDLCVRVGEALALRRSGNNKASA